VLGAILVCCLSWTTAVLVNSFMENNKQKLNEIRKNDQKRRLDLLYGRIM